MIKKYKIRLTEDEQNIIINGLLNWRNQLIKEGKYTTDAIDDLLLKLSYNALKTYAVPNHQ